MVASTTTFILSLGAIAIFIAGTAFGIYVTRQDANLTKENLQVLVGVVVTLIWIITILAEIIIPSYTVSILIHGIMGAVVGYLFSDSGVTFNIGG